MKNTYLIHKYPNLISLDYNSTLDEEDELIFKSSNKENIELKNIDENFKDGDWVYLDKNKNICLVNDKDLDKYFNNMNEARKKLSDENSTFKDYVDYKAKFVVYENYMQNPPLFTFEETNEILKKRASTEM